MGWVTRLELAISRATIWRFNQLSYTHHMSYLPCYMDYPRLRPTLSILHRFNHTPRYDFLEWVTGFEPATFWMAIRYSTNWAIPTYGISVASAGPVRLCLTQLHLHPDIYGDQRCGNFLSMLAYGTNYGEWCGVLDSNQWPPACKADALTSWANPAYIIVIE